MADLEEALRALLEEVDPQAASSVRPQGPVPRPRSVAPGSPSSKSLATRALGPTTSRSKRGMAKPVTVPAVRPRRGLRLAAVLGLLAGAGAAAWLVVSPSRTLAPAPAPVATAAPAVTPPAGPAKITLRFDVTPKEATVEVDGVRVNGVTVDVPPSQLLRVVVSAPGFTPETREIRPVASGDVKVILAPAAPTKPTRRTPTSRVRLPDQPL